MPWWAGNFVVVGGLALASWLVGLWIFRNYTPDSLPQWRWVNYTTLIIGGIGILGLLIDAQKDIGEREIAIERGRYHGEWGSFKFHMRSYEQYFCERKSSRTEISPPNFDDIIREQNSLCWWFKEANRKLETTDDNAAKGFKIEQIGGLPKLQFSQNAIPELADQYHRFHEERQLLLNAERRADTGGEKIAFSIFAPILLGIAFGLTLAKAQYVP
jgi:hypothetical protein